MWGKGGKGRRGCEEEAKLSLQKIIGMGFKKLTGEIESKLLDDTGF